jgi:predicted nuclease with TOPRIM domain
MNYDILFSIVSGLTTLAGAILTYLFARTDLKRQRERAQRNTVSYQEKMKKLSAELARSSEEVDKTLEEMEMVSRVREEALKSLEAKLSELAEREKDMQTRIDSLKAVPLPAAEYFLEMTEKSEKRSAARDYILFGAGVVVSTVIAIVLKLIFGI